MRLFRLTLATIFQRKSWAICVFALLVLPFSLPYISSATERPTLMQPAIVQTAWATLWVCCLIWGLFTAAKEGENNALSGIGEYFQTTGVTPTRQLGSIWLAVFTYIAPMVLITTALCQFTAKPANPQEQAWWWLLNLQYGCLILLVIAPLLVLTISISSRFGGISGFCITLLLAIYGLYGVGYLDNMLQVEENPIFRGLLLTSPQYRFADLTQRMYFKSGALAADTFGTMLVYFTSLGMILTGIARICFRTKARI